MTCWSLVIANNKPCSSSDDKSEKRADVSQEKASLQQEATNIIPDSLGDSSAASIPPANDDAGKLADATGGQEKEELVDFKIFYNKQKFDISFSLNATVISLKQHIETLIGVPASMQKLVYKGKYRYQHVTSNLLSTLLF